MLVATFFMASMHVIIKSLEGYHVFEIVFFRSSLTALLCTIYLRSKRISLAGAPHRLLLLRALFGIISMTLFFVTLQRMPMGASVSLKYLSPIFTAIFAVIILKEKVNIYQWVFFLTALLGVILLKGFDTRIDSLTFLLGLIGAIFGGLVYITIRRIGTGVHSMVIVNYFMLSATILSGIAMLPYWQSPSLYHLSLLILTGILGYFGQIFMTRSFQREEASRVAPIKYLEVIYSLLIGWLLFGEFYTIGGAIGILLILISLLLIFYFRSKPTVSEPAQK